MATTQTLERPLVGLFGQVNVGKSTLMNALTGLDVALVSEEPGTTTDPVRRNIELLGFGPVTLVDTPGIADDSTLGNARMKRAYRTLDEVNLALILFDGSEWLAGEEALLARIVANGIPYLVIHTHEDEWPLSDAEEARLAGEGISSIFRLSLCNNPDLSPLCEAMSAALRSSRRGRVRGLLEGLVERGDRLLLVAPIDSEAPAGRLILPQVQTLRAALDLGAIATIVQPAEVPQALAALSEPPSLVITDSQCFGQVRAMVPAGIRLTSFSVLLARQKGDFEAYVRNAPLLDTLKAGDRVLVLEGCVHQVSCEDIARVKIPRWLSQRVGERVEYHYISGMGPLPEDLSGYRLALICGGCMNSPMQIEARLRSLRRAGIPAINYGVAIAYMQGVGMEV